ncbi:MAG: hypothetical protein HON14_13785 [Rhodospirillaceae bacterium]|jgi:hypothetical protein|nr:hypothetical protein [Rhodospirillaceae bacterium]MBT4588355.1 hypothetical protein [Rhodospirillaceae bacterium]MBT4940199.1 hypothetical protein [Rhodospirillaceae bacterium]MBT7266060.1 hypothetical protein [Rhodospirillaceae bacterium]
MRYAIRYHEISSDWMVFNVGDGFELVGMHTSEKDAVDQVKILEKQASKQARFNNHAIEQAA